MYYKPWKLSLLAALSVSASAAFGQSAQKSLELEQYSKARTALLQQGNTPEASFELGRLYQLQDKADSAAIFFNRAAADQKSALGMVAAGRAALAQGKTSEAGTFFDNAVKATKSKDVKVLTMIAQAYGESDVKDPAKGLSYVEAGLKANKGKDDPALMVARGDIYLKSETGGGDAMSSYDRALLTDPNYTLANYRKGQLYVRSRNYNEARTAFEKAISLDPTYAPAYRDMAEMYFYAGQYDLALSTFQKYMGMAEKSTSTDAKYAAFLFLTKKYPEALTEIDKVLQKDPTNLAMNRLRAYSLYETGKNEEALAAMEKFRKTAPEGKVLKEDDVYYGKMLSKAGKDDQAITLLTKTLQADPKNTDMRSELAEAYLRKKDYPNAIATYKVGMTEGTSGLTEQILLARAYGSNKQYQQADSLYNIVLTARPQYAPGYQMRAQNAYNLDPESKQGLAKPYYEKYLELAKADPAKYKSGLVEANGYLGYYYFQKGEKATAMPYYQQVLTLDPSNEQAKAAMTALNGKSASRK